MRLVAYCRASVASDDSIGAQQERIQAWAEREDHDIAAVVVDNGVSGADEKRPNLPEALALVQVVPGRFNPWGAIIAVYFLATGITGLQLLGVESFVQQLLLRRRARARGFALAVSPRTPGARFRLHVTGRSTA